MEWGGNLLKGTEIPTTIIGENIQNQGSLPYYHFWNGDTMNDFLSVGDKLLFKCEISVVGTLKGTWVAQLMHGSWDLNGKQPINSNYIEVSYPFTLVEKDLPSTALRFRLDDVPTTTTLVFSNISITRREN